jgi:hypothetical protein
MIKRKLLYAVAMLTYPVWHKLVVIVMFHCDQKHIINDAQLHEILARLDKTQVQCCLKKAAMGYLG